MSFLKKKYSLTTALADGLSKLTTGSKSARRAYAEPISDAEDEGVECPAGEDQMMYRREEKTKAKYPVRLDLGEIDASLKTPTLTFVGAGLRSETFMTVEFWIYTIGLYVEPARARDALREFADSEAGSLHENEAFCRALVGMKDVTKVLRFVITLPGLKAGIVVSQFDKVLLPKMKAKGKEDNYRFIMNNMGKAKFQKGTKMFLALAADGTVTCICDGDVLGSVVCHTLCESIMDIYFGDAPVSADVKEKICSVLHATIQQEDEEKEEGEA